MYESFYGLARRPFTATPDATCFYATRTLQAALDELVITVEDGLGIAVATGPAGSGKTLLCERLIRELSSACQPVYLRHSNFVSRRALLQTLLAQLEQPLHRVAEQELRLELQPAVLNLLQQGRKLVVVVDEAHLLDETLLEELRTMTDWAHDGRPGVRLVLAGQLELEEKLASPGLSALGQRVRSHVCLETLSRHDSREYIDYRLTWGGGRTSEIISSAALDAMVEASDGLPRCLNQLCDHSMLLGYVSEVKPITVELVHEALRDLKTLPLHWNEPLAPRAPLDHLHEERDARRGEVAFTQSQPAPTPLIATSTPSFTDAIWGDPSDAMAIEIGANYPTSAPLPATTHETTTDDLTYDLSSSELQGFLVDHIDSPSATDIWLGGETDIEPTDEADIAFIDEAAIDPITEWNQFIETPLADSLSAEGETNSSAVPQLPDWLEAMIRSEDPGTFIPAEAAALQSLDATLPAPEPEPALESSSESFEESEDWQTLDLDASPVLSTHITPDVRITELLPLLAAAEQVEWVAADEPVTDAIAELQDHPPAPSTAIADVTVEEHLHAQVYELCLETQAALNTAVLACDVETAVAIIADEGPELAAEETQATIPVPAPGPQTLATPPKSRLGNLFSRLRRKQWLSNPS